MRKYYIDNIKWMTVVLVVIFHVFYYFNSNDVAGGVGYFYEHQPWDIIQYFLYPWFMALLFVVAGMNAQSALGKYPKEFVRLRTRKLLVPSTIGLFVFQWLQGYLNILSAGGFNDIKSLPIFIKYIIMALSGIGVLWSLQLLWLYSMILLLVIKIEQGRLRELCGKMSLWMILLLGIGFWFSAQVLNAPLITAYKFGIYGFSFFLGYFVFSHEPIIDSLSKWAVSLMLLSTILGISFSVIYFDKNYTEMPVFSSPLAMMFAYTSVLAILGAMKRWGDKKNGFTMWMSKKLWGLYIFHYLGISAVGYLLYIYRSLPIWAIYIVTDLSAFVIGFVLYEIMSRIPIVRWAVLGLKKEEICSKTT